MNMEQIKCATGYYCDHYRRIHRFAVYVKDNYYLPRFQRMNVLQVFGRLRYLSTAVCATLRGNEK